MDQIKSCGEDQLACVQLMAQFEMPHPDNRVEYDFWYSSSSEQALDFLKNFAPHHLKFKKDVFFTPHYVSWNCEECHVSIKSKHCFGDGKYCAFHYDNANHTGQEILYENLRQKCLHDYTQERNKEFEWWAYMKKVHTWCRDDISKECSIRGMKEIQVPFDAIEDCVNESFFSKNHSTSDNSILAKEAEYWKNYGPHFFPAIIINNVTYRGFLQVDHVYEAVCKGFKDAPSECNVGGKKVIQVIEGMSITTLILIIVGIISINLLLLYLYRR